MASTLKVNIVGDAKKFTKATKTAESSLQKLGKAGISSARMLKGALGAAGLAIGFSALTSQLQNATKAAVEDAKSQALLERQLTNTVGATKLQTAAVEDAITKMSLLSAVPDDEIRPAFAQLLRSTKSVTKATKLSNLALDVAAGTGKDVGTVAKALGKAYNGNTGALSKLGINVKKGGNWMKELKTQFKGMADVQARQDPIKRLKTTFDELQEKLGKGFVPLLNKVADWFNENYDKIAKFFTDAWNSDAMTSVKDTLKSIWDNVLKPFIAWIGTPEVQKAVSELFTSLGNIIKSLGDFGASDTGKAFKQMASDVILRSLELLSGLLNGIADAIDRINGKPIKGVAANIAAGEALNPFNRPGSKWTGNIVQQQGNFSNVGQARPVTVNVYASNKSGKEILDTVNKHLRSMGHGPLVFK